MTVAKLGGAPAGNQNAAKSRMFEQAVIRAIKQRDAEAKEDGATLRKIAENLLDMAAKDLYAACQLRDTLDGRPMQKITGEVTVSYVAQLPEVAPTADAWVEKFKPPLLNS